MAKKKRETGWEIQGRWLPNPYFSSPSFFLVPLPLLCLLTPFLPSPFFFYTQPPTCKTMDQQQQERSFVDDLVHSLMTPGYTAKGVIRIMFYAFYALFATL